MNTANTVDLIVIGGGAAGFFCAINVAQQNPLLKIIILEKSANVLSKVSVSGGGRCNVTHHCFDPTLLAKHYPRGERQLKNIFRHFQPSDVVEWFAAKGVKLKTEKDGRMFPVTDQSQTIIDCFLKEVARHQIEIKTNCAVESIQKKAEKFIVTTNYTEWSSQMILIATGGHPQVKKYQWIAALGHTIYPPIPSLFTFNTAKAFTDLMGISVPHTEVRIASTKWKQTGATLLTHWGLSGPAIIKLSAWAAEYLHSQKYTFTVLVNWNNHWTEEEVHIFLTQYKHDNGKQKVSTQALFELPLRLWRRLVFLAGIELTKKWAEISTKEMNRLIENLIRCPFHIQGKTTFKDEFVTCGGVALQEVDLNTLQSKKIDGLYFAGEVLNIDGETGGFNFQAAWSTAYLASRSIVQNASKIN